MRIEVARSAPSTLSSRLMVSWLLPILFVNSFAVRRAQDGNRVEGCLAPPLYSSIFSRLAVVPILHMGRIPGQCETHILQATA